MKVEAGDRGEIWRVAHIDRHLLRHARQLRLEGVERRVVDEERFDLVTALEETADDEPAFRDKAIPAAQ